MNTNEVVKRIDELIGMGEMIIAGNATDGSDRMKGFCNGIKALSEEIHGFGNQLSSGFGAIDVYDPRTVAKGMAILKDLRRLVLYAGEYGC
jgi:hypothetical protein